MESNNIQANINTERNGNPVNNHEEEIANTNNHAITNQYSTNIVEAQSPIEKAEIVYEKNEVVILMVGSNSKANKNTEKTNIDQYSLVDTDDPELFDGKIKCVRLKCIVFGIITCVLNTIRLTYLIFLHIGYSFIIWYVRAVIATSCFCCILFGKKEIIVDEETGRERIDYPSSKYDKACSLCKNCGKAFVNFIINLFTFPVWLFKFIKDCCYDVKNRALDNARMGCYKFIHYDCGFYEKVIEDPFNNYNKKRHIILTTDPDDESVIYGDACQNNIII